LSVIIIKYWWGDKVKKRRVGGACSANRRKQKCAENISCYTWKEEETLGIRKLVGGQYQGSFGLGSVGHNMAQFGALAECSKMAPWCRNV
jgi:hypothetical protein